MRSNPFALVKVSWTLYSNQMSFVIPTGTSFFIISRASPMEDLICTPKTSFKFVFESASTARIGPFPLSKRKRMIIPARVVLPVPPFPETAIVKLKAVLHPSSPIELAFSSDRAFPSLGGRRRHPWGGERQPQ